MLRPESRRVGDKIGMNKSNRFKKGGGDYLPYSLLFILRELERT